jgi:hypothetical protein
MSRWYSGFALEVELLRRYIVSRCARKRHEGIDAVEGLATGPGKKYVGNKFVGEVVFPESGTIDHARGSSKTILLVMNN